MKTTSLTYYPQYFIDTAPLAARYEVLTQAVLSFIAVGQFGRMLKSSQTLVRLVRVFTRLEAQNALLARKLDMLANKTWRERVLRGLGGLRKLTLWEAAQHRIKARLLARAERPIEAATSGSPSWLHTPERLAESERLKARVRDCRRASAHPLIFRDRCKMDFDGEFRLAPLLREPRADSQMTVYTQNTIVDYNWNPVPFAKVKGFGPASVWPTEFYAAAALEDEVLEEATLQSSPRRRGPRENNSKQLGPRLRGDEGLEKTIPLIQVLSPKVHRDLFGSLTS